jgi:hypothetical protein
MKRNTLFVIFPTILMLFLFVGTGSAQTILYEEYFTDGTTDIEWESAFFDSGTALTPMDVDSVADNPSGDGWVGVVHSDTLLGNIGLAVAGDDSLTDYTMEAQVYIVPFGGVYHGIMVRTQVDTVSGKVRGYQLVYSPFLNTMKFRYYVSIPDSVVTLIEYESSEIPGGAVTEASWHTMEIDADGDLFMLYWDGQPLPGIPLIDNTLTNGKFGIYCFDFMGPTELACDDIIISTDDTGVGDGPGDVGLPKAFNMSQNYPNPFNPMTTIRVDIPDGDQLPVTLDIFDLRGRQVRSLVDKSLSSGPHFFAWDGRNDAGESVPSGTYLYRLTRGTEVSTKKMIMTK